MQTTPPLTRARWTDAEKVIVRDAYKDASDADDFMARLPKPPTYPPRTLKGYLTYLNKEQFAIYHNTGRKALHDALNARIQAEEKAKLAAEAAKNQMSLPNVTPSPTPAPVATTTGPATSWVDEIDGTVAPPTPPQAPKPNFVRPTPDPSARVPKHFSFPTAKAHYTAGEIANTFNVSMLAVADAIARDVMPVTQVKDGLHGDHLCISHEDFLHLHDAMCDGFTFEEACTRAKAKAAETTLRNHQEKNLLVPAQELYAPEPGAGVTGATGPVEVHALVAVPREAMTPEGQPKVSEVPAKVLDATVVVPQTKTIEAQPVCKPVTGIKITDIDLHAEIPIKSLAFKAEETKATENIRRYTLEAVRDKVFTPTMANGMIATKDPDHTLWALILLDQGKITVNQAVKLIRWA
jgi:hypothetical protein